MIDLDLLPYNTPLFLTQKNHDPVYIGDPINACRIFSEKNASEILLCNIKGSKDCIIDFVHLEEICSESFVPLAYIGGVSQITDFDRLFAMGIEKVGVDQLLLTQPDIVKDAVRKYGSSSIMASITVQKTKFRGNYFVRSVNNVASKFELSDALNVAKDAGCGEFVIHASYNEGTYSGIDDVLVSKLPLWLNSYPVTYMGGIGSESDVGDVLESSFFTGVGLGSLCVFSGQRSGILVRYPNLSYS